MEKLSFDYRENVRRFDGIFNVRENFDVIKKVLTVGRDELTFYYIDGLLKDGAMEKLLMYFVGLGGLGESPEAALAFLQGHTPYVETDLTDSPDFMIHMTLSGAALMIGSTFGDKAIVIDARTYPAREPSEPENDRVMFGSRDGFVETLLINTALIRRRIRDPRLTMRYFSVGQSSKTDVVVCYMKEKAKESDVEKVIGKIRAVKTEALTLGHQSLCECLLRSGWYNPFPKVRTTERPDTAAAHLLEGSIMILVDNSPEVITLPTSIFDFVQETNDYYFPPLTGSFMRLLRVAIMFLTLFMTPIWFLLVKNPDIVPAWLTFTLPHETGKIPILSQLLLAEFVIDGLRMASMNTPDMLSNSLSVVGGLILGDFAVDVGWFIPEVILYMAFVSIANFSQRNYELAYAFKFLRLLMVIMTGLFNVVGFALSVVISIVLMATSKTILSTRGYLYPLIPFSASGLLSLVFRPKKKDVK